MKKDFELSAVVQEPTDQAFCALYGAPGETAPHQVRQRVARALARDAAQEARFLQAQCDGLLCGPAIARRAGTLPAATLADGFVQPLQDTTSGSIEGLPGIMEALVQAVETIRHGASVSCDFSRLRPVGAASNGLGVECCGPLAAMQVLARACQAWGSGRAGRGALETSLRVDHPDIERFLDAMSDPAFRPPGADRLTVGITDAFMQAVEGDAAFALVHLTQPSFAAGQIQCADGVARYVYRTVRARDLWHRLQGSVHGSGEPGVLYVDRLQHGNNLWYCERLAGASPCGGPVLPFYGGCCAAAVDLTRFVSEAYSPRAKFRHADFARVVATGVELLDRVLDASHWPLAAQAAQAQAKRRIALGFAGLVDAMAMLGLRPGAERSTGFAHDVARTMRDAAYRASVRLAASLGAFPLFDADGYLDAQSFAATLPPELQQEIRDHGIRNSHLLWLPPDDHDWIPAAHAASHGRAAGDPVASQDGLALLATLAPYVDGGVAATIRLPVLGRLAATDDAYLQAWRIGLQACRVVQPCE